MDLSLILGCTIIAGFMITGVIPRRRRITRFVCQSAFFVANTALIMALVGSPVEPLYLTHSPGRIFWLQVLTCFWWAFAAREVIALLQLLISFRKGVVENKLLFDVVAGAIYICSVLAMIGVVFRLSLQGLLATSGIVAIVLGLALQSTLSDLFSGISLTIEKPYQIGDEILLDGVVEGRVIQINWRSTHLRNPANDVVVIPNSAIAKMRIQNHTTESKRYSGTVAVTIDSRNDPEFVLEILKQIAVTCPAILEHPPCTIAPTDLKGDRITYEISYSTSAYTTAGNARAQLICQIYKRARPAASPNETPLYLFPESEVVDHLSVLDPLTPDEKKQLSDKVVKRLFQPGDRVLVQGEKADSVCFIYSGVLQVSRQVQDGRTLNVRRLGPGDTYGEASLLTGAEAVVTLTAVTSGLILEAKAEALKPILAARPQLVESLSRDAAKIQKLVDWFDHSASQPAVMVPHDLLWRIRNFFGLDTETTETRRESSHGY